MPQYLLSVWHDHEGGEAPPPEEMAEIFADVDRYNAALQEEGAWVFAGGLQPPASATVVDATGDRVSMTDGPFLEVREMLGGFWIVEAADLDAALALAERGSRACRQRVEVRPFQDESDG